MEARPLLLALLALPAAAQVAPRVTNSLGCDHFGNVNGVTCSITLVEGLNRVATLTLDEPIVCTNTDDFECSVIVNISNSHPHIVAVEPCYVRWDRTEWHQPRYVRITAVQNYRDDPSETHQIHLNAQVLSMASYYNNFAVQDFFIETVNRRTAQCRSTGDPHLVTFDGKYWHFYRASYSTLYRAPNRDFAIQTRTRGYPSRNCGIAGREGPDRVIIDKCDGYLRIQTDFNSNNSQVHPRVQVSGNTYTVYFFSGAWMRAQINGWGMNVYVASVDPSPANRGNGNGMAYSCGLCGNFDGNRANDVPGFRVTSYDALWPCMKVPSIAVRPRDRATISFGNIWDWRFNASDFTALQQVLPLPRRTCRYRFQRIVRPIINTEDTEDINNALNLANQVQNTTNGFGFTFGGGAGGNSTVVANAYPLNLSVIACQQQIDNSATVQYCSQLYAAFNDTLANYTDDCAVDYSHAGGPTATGATFLAASLRALEARCLQLAVQNNDTTVTALQQVLCDNACSGRGQCGVGARCICNSGWGGTDCSIDLNAPPTLTSASSVVYDSSGLQRNHTPQEILVSGTNFLFGPNLTCRFNATETRATYIGLTQVLCEVPVLIHRGVTPLRVPLQVSNNGTLWSNATGVQFTYYDGHCQACTDAAVCGPNPATCTIGGQCYLPHTQRPAGAGSPTNPCMVCLPAHSNRDWTYSYAPDACRPVFSARVYGTEIVGAATAGAPMLTVDATRNPLVRDDPSYAVNYTYSSATSNASGIRQWFLVNPTTGVVTLNESVNMSDPVFMNMQHAASNPQSFNGFFRVVATDQQGYTSTADVSIDLVPITVHGAIFPPSGFLGVVDENSAPGSPVFNLSNPLQPLVIAPTADNVTVASYEWFLQPSGMSGALSVNRTTGAVTVVNGGLLDYERTWQLNYRVRATVALQYIVPLYIEVRNVQEPPTAVVATPVTPTIVEGTSRASDFVANLSTVDGDANATYDGGPFTYTLVSGLAGFELREWVSGDSRTTYLAARSGVAFDYESAFNVIDVAVRSADPTGRAVTTNFRVRVTDFNEAPASIVVGVVPTPPPGVTVVQQGAGGACTISTVESLGVGALVAALSATDPDAGSAAPLCFVTDDLGHFSQDAQRRFMMLATPLDFEANSSFSVTVTCVDAGDFSLETSLSCLVTVVDAPEAPVLTGWAYTGGAINETETRTADRSVGTMTAVDFDAGSSTSGQTITFGVPAGYSATAPQCAGLAGGALRCTADLVLGAATPLAFVNSAAGTVTVPVTLASGGLSRAVAVNVTVADQPELPTGVAVTLQGPLYEQPPVGLRIALLTVQDPDTTTQAFDVSLTHNPSGAFALELVAGDARSRWLTVANSSAFEYRETLARRGRRQAASAVPYALVVSEPAHPELGSFPFASSVNVSDRPLEAAANATVISPVPGADLVQFSLRYQDISTLVPYLRWTLTGTTLDAAMGAVALSPSGALTVTSPGGLCPDGGVNAFLVTVRYDFSSYAQGGGVLPPGYGAAVYQTELTIGDADAAYPVFSNAPAGGGAYSVSVLPGRWSPSEVSSALQVAVGAPCGATVGYNLDVVTAPEPVRANRALTGTELVRDGGRGYVRPRSLAELNANLASGVWRRADVYSVTTRPAATSASQAFAFTTFSDDDGVAQTGTATTVTVRYRPRSRPALGYTDSSSVLLAEIAGTGRVALANLTVRYLDPCGVDAGGAEVRPSPCAGSQACVASFASSSWGYSCVDRRTTAAPPAPPPGVGAQGANETDSGALGVYVGIVLAAVLGLIVIVALVLRRRKVTHVEWDASASKNRLPTYINPVYEAAGGGSAAKGGVGSSRFARRGQLPGMRVAWTPGDTAFRPGVANAMYEWYKPPMTRRECTDYLMAQGEGAFVVRDSDANPGWHMLGVKTANRVVHDKIRRTEAGEYELLPSIGAAADVRQPSFTQLPELVDHYVGGGEQAGLGYALVENNPIYDNNQLIQERTGVAVRKAEGNSPAVPEKRQQYDVVPPAAAVGGPNAALVNPTYVPEPGSADGDDKAGGAAREPVAPDDGYLDVGADSDGKPDAAP